MRLMLFGYSVALTLLTGLMLLGETRGQGVGGAGSTCVNVTLGPCAGNTAFADGAPDYNTSIGKFSLPSSSAGQGNSAFGFSVLASITTGSNNSAFGNNSLASLSTGNDNAAFGAFALVGSNGGNNSAFGVSACQNLTTGSMNTCFGEGTGLGITTGSNNTIIGASVTGLPAALSGAIILATGDGVIHADYNKTTAGQWTLPQTAFTAPVIMNTYTFATLPACATAIKGARAFISDGAATPTFTAAAAGGGTLFTPVYCDGTTWRNG